MDRLTSIAVFVAAIEEGSIAAAGRRLELSSVMAGRYLSSLEDSLSARLIQRTTRRIALTDTGIRYFARCKRILDELEEANQEAAATQSTPRGTLRLSAPVTFGAAYLGPIAAEFMAEYAGVRIEVQLQDRFVDLVEEGIDIAIRIGRLVDSDLVAWPIGSCSLIACAAPDYLARRGDPQSPGDLMAHERIGYMGTVSTIPWSFEEDGGVMSISEPCRFVANNAQMIAEAALAGCGIAYGPSFAFAKYLEQEKLVQVLPSTRSPTLPIHAVTPTARHVPQKVRAFRDRLSNAFSGSNAPWERWRTRTSAAQVRK